jgi:hypothetical protein
MITATIPTAKQLGKESPTRYTLTQEVNLSTNK